MFKLMDDCMLTFSGRTVDVRVRANINVVKRVSVLCVCVAFLTAGFQNLWRGPIVKGFLQKSTRENRGKGGTFRGDYTNLEV